ncbi:MAG: TonB-dependent receptor [Desulfobacterales bacterium]|nr:TonB-dependent receptor [Desulfobacterales bacterium]
MAILALIWVVHPCRAENEAEIVQIDQIKVTAPRYAEPVEITPSLTVIDMETYETPSVSQNITDIIKDRVIVDFKGQSDLVPSNDTVEMRGFDAKRFIVAIDGMTVEKSGFGYSNYAVDYALLSPARVAKIEILAGPHSALYPGQSIGGVLNIITKTPHLRESKKPDVKVSSSYRSYNTQNHQIDMDGGVGAFNYGVGVQKYHTDGYLRHNEVDIETVYGNGGWVLPSDGYISLTGSYTEQDHEFAANNDPAKADYDPDYPDLTVASYNLWQDATRDKKAYSFRLNYMQPSSWGQWSVQSYYNRENHDQHHWEAGYRRGVHARDVVWDQLGAKVQDKIEFSSEHISTVGVDYVVGYSEWMSADWHKRLDRKAGFLEHNWKPNAMWDLKLGLRYEDIQTYIHNRTTDRTTGAITGYYNNAVKTDYIARNFDDVVPKSFLTCHLDSLSSSLRDTSVSLGVSKIWHAPTSGMDMHGNGLPGLYIEPEHGVGYDLIAMRRLWGNVQMKVDFAYYEIEDYIAYNNRQYADYIPSSSNPVPPGMEYLDARINLEKVIRRGVDLEFDGKILDNLSFYAGYAFQEFENKGSELVGKEEVDDRAKHRVTAGLRYKPLTDTTMMLDYKYQSRQVAYSSIEVAPDDWVFYAVPMKAYHVFDLACRKQVFEKFGHFRDGQVKLYINNLLNETYEDSRGYPMTDRTVGVAISFAI